MSLNAENHPDQEPRALDVVVVGAGLGGLYALYKLRSLGLEVRALEAAPSVGGTWYWNAYPGARCDVESLYYSYSFSPELEQEWVWTERYPRQPELLRYIEHVADRFDLRQDIELRTRVSTATFDEVEQRWELRSQDGRTWSARYVVMATGSLSTPIAPRFEGLDDFEGDWYLTQAWPQRGVDFTGKRVAVVGTGSSAIQAIPEIAKQAEHLYVFQRTANFSVPAHNSPLDPEEQRRTKVKYRDIRAQQRVHPFGYDDTIDLSQTSALEVTAEERDRQLEHRWQLGGSPNFNSSFADLMTRKEANDTVADFVRRKIRSTVTDPAVAELLTPTDHPIGAKRLCVDSGYFETYNRDDVTLVDARRSPITRFDAQGLQTSSAHYDVDAVVFALGYDALSGALLNIDVVGRDGARLRDHWAHGPKSYLGLCIAGFPNLFTITGPGSPAVLAVMTVAIEQHVDWVADAISDMRERGLVTMEATPDAEESWVQHVADLGSQTLFPLANSYYMGANVPGKPRVFLPYVGGLGTYRETCDAVAADGYRGFAFASASGQRETELPVATNT